MCGDTTDQPREVNARFERQPFDAIQEHGRQNAGARLMRDESLAKRGHARLPRRTGTDDPQEELRR